MYSRVPLHKVRYITLERCGAPRRIPQRTRRLTFFSKPNPRRIWPFLMASLSSTPEMASSTTTSQAPRRGSPGLFTIFHEEVTAAPSSKPTRRSPSKSNKVTVSHSNKLWWRAQHYARMQSKNTKGVQILLTQIPPKQQMLGKD